MSSFYDDASLVMIPSCYKVGTVLCEKPTDGSGDLTFTRTGDTATRVNSAGLIERVRTNLILQSEAFNTTWSAGSLSVTANTTANPLNGALTADTINLGGGTVPKYLQQSVTAFNGLITHSVYLKAGTHQFVQLISGETTVRANFDLINGTSSSVNSTAQIVALANNWYRCSISYTATISPVFVYVWAVDSLASSRAATTASTGTFFIFGYQHETGDIATAYIPTTTAAVSVGPVANLPRLDYLGSSCPRLLLEPQRTNLMTYSEQFNNANWFKYQATITSNSTTSPDGYTNADTIADSAVNDVHIAYQNTAFTAGSYTVSCYAKANTLSHAFLQIYDGANFYASGIFNLTNGTVSGAGSITSAGNGWYRLSLTATVATGAGYSYVGTSNGSSVSYAGSGQSIYIWGYQTEAGAYPTSLIPTLASASTRSADLCYKTGISSLIGQTEGTLFVDAVLTHNTASNEYLIQVRADNPNRFFIYREANTNKLACFALVGAATIYTQLTASAITGTFKAAFAYKSGSFAFYVNGVQVGTSAATYTLAATLSQFFIDQNNGLEFAYDTYNQAIVFPTRLTNAELAELTTL
jgi:hypothetical protein